IGNGNLAYVWNIAPGPTTGVNPSEPLVLGGHTAYISTLAFSPDGRWVVTGSDDKTVRLWDLTAQTPRVDPIVFREHEDAIRYVFISAETHWLITTSYDGTTRLHDLSALDTVASPISLLGTAPSGSGAILSPNGRLAITRSRDHSLIVR